MSSAIKKKCDIENLRLPFHKYFNDSLTKTSRLRLQSIATEIKILLTNFCDVMLSVYVLALLDLLCVIIRMI